MTDLLYDGEPQHKWLEGLSPMDDFNVKHLLSAFALLGVPQSYLDVGCGTGIMVKTAEKLGVQAYGVDQLVDDTWPKNFYHKNLVDRFILPTGQVDLVTSFEVGEHLHETAHATYCGTLADNLMPGNGHYLLFSAARPGQGGTGHIACRPAEYWHYELSLRGVAYNRLMTMNLALLWSNIQSPLNYMWDNLIVFNK
jgi:SAM-dependent methyltransferase